MGARCKLILNALVKRSLGKCLRLYSFRGTMGKLNSPGSVVDCRNSGSRLDIPDHPGVKNILGQRRSVGMEEVLRNV